MGKFRYLNEADTRRSGSICAFELDQLLAAAQAHFGELRRRLAAACRPVASSDHPVIAGPRRARRAVAGCRVATGPSADCSARRRPERIAELAHEGRPHLRLFRNWTSRADNRRVAARLIQRHAVAHQRFSVLRLPHLTPPPREQSACIEERPRAHTRRNAERSASDGCSSRRWPKSSASFDTMQHGEICPSGFTTVA